MFRKITYSLLLLAFAGAVHAQAVWSEIAESKIPLSGERRIVPQIYRTVRLDADALKPLLTAAPERFTSAAAKGVELPVLTLPMPDGSTRRFRLTESPVMAPELQEQYPEIRCYTGRGIEDPTALLKCDFTPQGFHAMILSTVQGTVFIDPYSQGDTKNYIVYYKKDYLAKSDDAPFICSTPDEDWQELTLNETAGKQLQGDCQLRRYRLALACTGEYTVFHGGTIALALAAMNTTMNRVNGVYENDFAITMQLIANNTQIMYTSGGSDPYSNGNAGAMLTENQSNVPTVIGSANFDIGHVFGTNSGGVAGLGVVCNNNSKARGVTGSGSPVGDPFDIDYVAHEMGHQFGGPHSFNGNAGSCNGNGSAANAVEPGSGTTIMAYAGICGAQDVQPNSDDYFHANSIQRITTYAINGNGNNCPVKIATNNTNPTVDAGPDYTIPKSTPFSLTATGSDADGDTLSYCWEQMDAALGTPNPPAATNATGPLFRSFKGTASPTRWFPRLSDLVTNTNYAWEELPGVARNMNFRVVLRDNNDGAGCTDEDDVLITVSGTAGPFQVTEPNTNVLWYVGETRTVTWNVNATDIAPVNCANVRILLSTDGGFNYPVVLAASVPNTGSAVVFVPNNLSNTCRVKVEAIGNIFFDISNINFRIQQPPVPTFTMLTTINAADACAGDTVAFSAVVGSVLGFSDPVTLEVSGLPAGATLDITPNPVIPGNSAGISISGLTPAMAGSYTLNVKATSGAIVQNASVQLDLLPGIPANVLGSSPTDGTTGLPQILNLVWDVVPFAENYTVQLATSPAFSPTTIIQNVTGVSTSLQTVGLQTGLVYYWRVRATNGCGASDYSPAYAFQVGNLVCNQVFNSVDAPQPISADAPSTIISSVDVSAGIIADVDLTVIANHTFVGDLDARLVSPANDTISLFDRPGVPATQLGCEGNNLTLIFNDAASLSAAVLEQTCNGVNPALLGEFQPISPLGVVNGKNAEGSWKILFRDNSIDDGGSFLGWGLSFCFANDIPPGVFTSNNPLSVPVGGSELIANTHLAFSGIAALTTYTLLELPQHGTLLLNGAPLSVGGTFTQDDIDFGLVGYQHNGDGATADDFLFDVLDSDSYSWIHNATFNIIIIQNNLAATLAQTGGILCPGDANGQITVTATGLDGQYEYSLDGTNFQTSNVFNGLAAGTYTVVVAGQFGFTATSSPITLNNPPALTLGTSVAADVITANAGGGTGAYEYSIDGAGFQASNQFSGLSNGIYTVFVRDANGCIATAQAIVAVNSLLATLDVQQQVTCFGGNDGVIVATVGGGQAPIEYSLDGVNYQISNVFAGLPAGTYNVQVKDGQGFTAATNAVTLISPGAITVSATANLNVVTTSASGGTGPYEYSLDGVNYQISNEFGGLSNGDYTITVRDSKGCTSTGTVTVNVPALSLGAVGVSGVILCYGDATATLLVTATGGIPPYEYALNGGAFQIMNEFKNVSAGPNVITVRDALGTEVSSAPLTLQQPAPVVAGVTVTGNDAQFSASGGTAPYTFEFNGPTPPVNLPNGDYTVVVIDANGCMDTAQFSVALPPLTATVQTQSTDPCVPSATIEVTASGGEGPYEYSLNGGAFQSGNTFTVFPGQNNVRVRDMTGMIVQIPVNVSLPAPIQLTATATSDTIIATAQSGTQPYLYSIDGVNFQVSPVFPGLPNGDYTVTVKDENGCTATATATVSFIGSFEPEIAWGMRISPNPGAGLFRISLLQAPASLRLEVFDAAGRSLRTLDFNPAAGGEFTAWIDLQDVPQGVYFLRLTDGVHQGGVRLSVMR